MPSCVSVLYWLPGGSSQLCRCSSTVPLHPPLATLPSTRADMATAGVHLSGSGRNNSGRLELRFNGAWGAVSSNGNSNHTQLAELACAALGFSGAVVVPVPVFIQKEVTPSWSTVTCPPGATSIDNCTLGSNTQLVVNANYLTVQCLADGGACLEGRDAAGGGPTARMPAC